MIAFPSQEKGNALYTLHNRIFHLSDSGIEYQIYLIFNSFIIIFRLECLVKILIHLSFLSDLESAKFSIHLSFLSDVESFIKFSNHLAFVSDLEFAKFSILLDLESYYQVFK